MPLLGRSSKTSSSSSGSQQQQQQKAASMVTPSRRPQLCESPLFGTRRQLPSPTQQVAGSSGARGLSQSSDSKDAQLSNELSSIPQQITSQQIHYAFSIIDVNKDGMIDLKDLSQMLANLGLPIDEAILSHLMTTVSKRGDHRISEAEFLEWLSKLIQINDPDKTKRQSQSEQQQPPSKPGKLGKQDKGRVSRSSTALGATMSAPGVTSLVAQQPEAAGALRNRRGSGSGLALMRSLSASAASSSSKTGQTSGSSSSECSSRAGSRASSPRAGNDLSASDKPEDISELDEARSDLKAAFCVFDLDGDGFITLDEVRAGLKLLGESWSPAELRQVFSKCKSSTLTANSMGDLSRQRISIDDFVQLLL